jgi:hypothetical protein
MIEGNQILSIFMLIKIIELTVMLLVGLIALIQTIFLPGILILYFVKIKTQSIIQKYVYIFALSLFANYTLVTILVLLQVYVQNVIFLIIFAEILLLIFLLVQKRLTLNNYLDLNQQLNSLKALLKENVFVVRALTIVAVVITLFYFSLFISNIGTIFYFVDTVKNIHWNTWAIDFSNNIFPVQSSHFPQLIPSNWSISYLLTGDASINFFPKSIMPLFFLCNILMFFDLALYKRKAVYLVALIIYGLFSPIVYSLVFIADGNGDLPVSFFAFLSFYAYLKTDKEKFNIKEYILVFLFASTAAGTKLAGFYIFFFMSILCLFLLLKNYRHISKKDVSVLLASVIFILGTNLFWYFIKPQTMASGLHQPEWLQSGYINILSNALHLLYYNIGLPVLAFMAITVLFSLAVKEVRYVAIIFVIPPIILWMFKYSSDFRNLSFVVPFISFVSAFGLIKIFEIIRNKNSDADINIGQNGEIKLYRKKIWYYVITSMVCLLLFVLISSDMFYNYLYKLYVSVNRYYFQSNRITYLTDFTFFLPVDFYQKTLALFFLIVPIVAALTFFRIKIKHFIALILTASIVSNFFVNSSDIKECQQTQLYKVDARNYYARLKIIIESAKLKKSVITNFRSICSEKIPRQITFSYLQDNEILNKIETNNLSTSRLVFLKMDKLKDDIKSQINSKIKNKEYNLLYDDGDYVLIEI